MEGPRLSITFKKRSPADVPVIVVPVVPWDVGMLDSVVVPAVVDGGDDVVGTGVVSV